MKSLRDGSYRNAESGIGENRESGTIRISKNPDIKGIESTLASLDRPRSRSGTAPLLVHASTDLNDPGANFFIINQRALFLYCIVQWHQLSHPTFLAPQHYAMMRFSSKVLTIILGRRQHQRKDIACSVTCSRTGLSL